MADYTTDEINSSVSGLVTSNITLKRDVLGTRRTDITFSDVQSAVAGVFILYPLAPFYCVRLGGGRTNSELVASEASTISSIREALGSLNRFVQPVDDVSPLANAVAGLQALEGAVSTTAPTDITKLAQYQRFAKNAQLFLRGPAGQAVKQGGAIVPTPAEARASLPGLMSSLQSQHVALVDAVTKLAGSIDDYNRVNLPSVVASGVISNAASLLQGHFTTLNGLTPAQRLEALRQPVLDVIAAQTAVTTMGSYTGPNEFYSITGSGRPYSDGTHLATSAVLDGTRGAPFNVQVGVNDSLTMALDGVSSVTVKLPLAVGASVGGTVVEIPPPAYEGGTVDGYLIGNGTHPTGLPTGYTIPNNNSLHFKLASSLVSFDVTVTLIVSSDGTIVRRSAQDISDDINTALGIAGATGVAAAPYFYPSSHFSGGLDVTPGIGHAATFTQFVPGSSSFSPVVIGDILIIVTGPNADIWDVTGVTPTSVQATARVVTPAAQTNVQATMGPKDRGVRLSITNPAYIQALMTLTILGDTPAASSGATAIGWPINATFNSSLPFATDLSAAINQQTTKAVAGIDLLSPIDASFTTDPANPFHVVALKYQSVGTLAFGSGAITLTGIAGLLAAGVGLGDIVVLRGQNNSAWTVTVISNTSLTATGGATPTTGPGVAFDVGPSLSVARWQSIVVPAGLNSGSFVVKDVGVSPIDILLMSRSSIPHYQDQITGLAVVFAGQIGEQVVTISSVDRTTSSSVGVSGSAVALLWTSPPTSVVGTTPYFFTPIPTAGGTPTSGDLLEFYATQYNAPSLTCVVQSVDVETGGLILDVSPELSDLPTSWVFPPSGVPYVTLRHGHVVDFADFQVKMNGWLAAPPQRTSLFFQSLNGVINPLIANQNPTAAEIGSALAKVQQLADLLDIADATRDLTDPTLTIESILDSYAVDPVPQVDTLIKTYTQKGCDLALDTLLAGQFASFFGLNEAGSSYAGAMQSAMIAVAQNDLPVRKVNRPDALQSRLLGNAPSTDYEYSADDVETGLKPDAPQDFEKS